MPWAKIIRSLGEERGWTPRTIAEGFTVHQLIALGAPAGKVSKEQAFEIINARREKKGMDPICYLP